MKIEERYDEAIAVGERAYNNSEGDLSYALDAALQHFAKSLLDATNEQIKQNNLE